MKNPVSLFASLLAVATALSQSAAQTTTDDIVHMQPYNVTGSHIPYAADALASTLSVIGQNDIQTSGVSGDLLDLLKKQMPQFTGIGNIGSNNANINGNLTNGGSMLALRNAPTLVLINGRRAAFAPVAASGFGLNFVDVNLIPVSAIERIEVLNDGASAIYGSDAVSGVVNIILKSNFQGLEIGGNYKIAPTGGHWQERSARLTGGFTHGNTSITISLETLKSDPLYQNARPFSANQSGLTGYFPGIASYNGQLYLATPGKVPPAGTHESPAQLVQDGYYTGPYESSVLRSKFNIAPYVTLALSNQRTAATVTFNHNFTPRLELFGDILYSNVKTFFQLAAMSVTSMPLYSAYAVTDATGGLTGMAAANYPLNPFDAEATPRNRFVEHPRLYDTINNSIRALAGLRGKIADGWTWETAINHNAIAQTFNQPNMINRARFLAAVDSGLINLFAVNQAPGALEQSGIFGAPWQINKSALTTLDFRINGTIKNSLPAGPLQFAAGAEARRERLSGRTDPGSKAITDVTSPYFGETAAWENLRAYGPLDDTRNILAAFLQIRAPIASPAQHIPGLYTLELDAAIRHEHYNDTGGATLPKLTLRYQPFDRQLAFRATYAESFNAPSLLDLAGGLNNTAFTGRITNLQVSPASPYYATANIIADAGQAVLGSAGNPALKPEKGKTYNAGIIYTPAFAKGLSAELNYFAIKRTGLADSVSDQTVMQDVELNGPSSPYASQVRIGSFAGAPVTAPGQISAIYQRQGALDTPGASGVYRIQMNMNMADSLQDGVDAALHYNIATREYGNFDLNINGTWYNRYIYNKGNTHGNFAGTTSGRYTDPGIGTIPRWTANALVTWEKAGWQATLYAHYIPPVRDLADDTRREMINAYYSFDATLGYSFRKGALKGLTLRVGCNNLFNRMPPTAPDTWTDANADIGTYGYLGRVLYVDASYKF